MLRGDGIVKVLDFGIAKLTEPEPPGSTETSAPTGAPIQTEQGAVMGTDAYMSPEQARGRAVDGRSDIWSLGVVLYELLSGRPPFEGETSSHVIVSILEHEPPPLAHFAPDVSPELQRIVRKCLAKDRDERYQTARDLMIDLKNLRRESDLQTEIDRFGAPATQTGTRGPTPSAGRVVSEIRARKRGAVLIGALAAVVAASVLFLQSRRPGSLTEKDTILLTDLVNTTGDTVFDGTLKQALAVQLGQSPSLNIFSEDRVRGALRFMGRPADERVTREIGREICQRHGLKAMLTGSIASLGTNYVIALEVVNAQTGDVIARDQMEATSKEQVLRALGGSATRLRKKLGESLASIQKFDAPIEQATTSSIEAFKAFSLAVEQQLRGNYFEAIPLYKRAAEMDPSFALAYARLASVYSNSGEFRLAAEASQRAYDLRDRVSEREKLYIGMSYYSNVTRELDKYVETLELWELTYPRDVVPRNTLSLHYNDMGEYAKAVEEAREGIGLNPNAAPLYSNLARALVGLDRFDEAKEVIGQAMARKVESLFMHRLLYSIAFIQGDEAGMQRQIEWASGKPEEYVAQSWQAETAAFSGQLRKATGFYSRAVEIAQGRNRKEVVAQIVAADALRDSLFGACRQIKEKTSKVLAIESQPAKLNAANALAGCGEFSRMQAVIDELMTDYPKDTLLQRLFVPLIQARAELHRGNAARAIEFLETTRPYEGAALFQVAYLRGQAYLGQQKGAEAATEFQKILDHRGWQPATPLYPLAHLGLARAAVLQGDTATARRAYEALFALWKDADAGLPILLEAKTEYEKLKPV